MKIYKSKRWVKLLKGILFIFLGAIALYQPEETLETVGLYIGWVALISGVFYLIQSYKERGHDLFGWLFVEGILDIVLGLLILLHPVITVEVLPFLLGIWLLFMGITQISVGIFFKGILPINYFWLFLRGGISIIAGFIILSSPIFSGLTITTFLGIYFLAYGLMLSFSIINWKKKNV